MICHAEYGIPAARLAELAGGTRQSVGGWIRGRHAVEVAQFAARRRATERVSFTEITAEAAAALARESERSGVPAEVLASAAILASCSK